MQTIEHKPSLPGRLLPKTGRQWILTGLVGGAIALLPLTFYTLTRSPQASTAPVPGPLVARPEFVTALGRLEPKGEVIKLAASSTGSRILQLLVQQGDTVRSGQVIAVLDSRDRLQAALEQALGQVQIARTRLAQVQAGAKSGEIDAQAATVTRLEAELSNAEIEYRRYQNLYQAGAISASQLDSKRLVMDTTKAQIRQAKQTLQSVAEVRPVDVQAAQAEVEAAIAAAKQAQASLDLAYIRAPRSGQILKVHTWAGEIVGNDGIVELGQTQQMYVVAEVYESDVQRVKVGQQATMTSNAFAGSTQGTVERIGLKIDKNDVLSTDPTAASDARVVEVKIRLDPASTQKVKGLTNLQVTVQISLGAL